MDIVKKNLISIICGLVALATLLAVFVWPLDGFFDTLKEKATKRAAVQAKVAAIKNKPRIIPIIDPNNPKPSKLTKFPSKQIIGLGDSAQKKVHEFSLKMYDAAWRLNQQGHGLVVPGTLPLALDTSAFKFRRQLMEALDKLRTEDLAAGIPPTPEQLKLREDALLQSMKKDIIVVDGKPTNEDLIMARFEAERVKLPDLMKKEMATENKMYIDPSKVLMVSPSLPVDTSPTPQAIWWSQVAFWVDTDVAAAIKELNANSTSVLDSPIKNLIALSVPEDFFPPLAGNVGPRIGEVEGTDSATPATGGRPDATIALPDGNAGTPTKRTSNNLFDVIQFKMTLDIEADKIPLFLKTLATNRFVTVTRVEMNPVDSQAKQISGYVYGPRPVVTLDLDCEALFMREWTIPWMPPVIRRALSIPDSPTKSALAP